MRLFCGLLVAIVATTATLAKADAPATQPSASSILIMPFRSLAPGNGDEWIGTAIQQDFVAELSRMLPGTSAGSDASGDPAAAAQAGKSAGARKVIVGSYQLTDEGIRITGQVIDTTTGNTVGALKATGSPHELFQLEDALTTQAKRLLIERPKAVAANPPATPPAETTVTRGELQINYPRYEGSSLDATVSGRANAASFAYYHNLYIYQPPAYIYGPYGYGGYYGGSYYYTGGYSRPCYSGDPSGAWSR